MTVITISREFGSGGDLLAERVADKLGYHLVDKNFFSAVLCQYGLAEFDLEYEKQLGFWESFDTEKVKRRELMVRMLNQVVRTVARHGNVVILGRSGYAILAGLADVIHIRVQAPLDNRIDMIKAERNIPREAAITLVQKNDAIRTAFIESFYRVSWESPRAFDISINTAVVPISVANVWVTDAARLLGSNPSDKPTTKQIEIDPTLMQVVTEKLNCSTAHT